MTQSAAIVTGRADALVVASVGAAAASCHLIAAVTVFGTQIVASADVLQNVVSHVKICVCKTAVFHNLRDNDNGKL